MTTNNCLSVNKTMMSVNQLGNNDTQGNCPNFTSVTEKKNTLTKSKSGEKVLFILQFRVRVNHFREVNTKHEAGSHTHSQEQEEIDVCMLLISWLSLLLCNSAPNS